MARLTTAAEAKQADLAAVAKSLERLTGKTVEISAAVDPSLIGGATARIGSVIYDGSIRTQLAKMRERLEK
jgi:F-type H+-transporting ATPase subunit delta